jgi:hypothetical protein
MTMEKDPESRKPAMHPDVARVMAGEARYDDVDAEAQAAVRAVWDQGMAERVDGIDLAAEFQAQGLGWSECDEQGRVVLVHPDGTRKYAEDDGS